MRFFNPAFDIRLLGGGEFSAFSDESRIFSINFLLRKLCFVVLRFASLTLFYRAGFYTRATRKRLTMYFRFHRGSKGVRADHARALTPLLKIQKKTIYLRSNFYVNKGEREEGNMER